MMEIRPGVMAPADAARHDALPLGVDGAGAHDAALAPALHGAPAALPSGPALHAAIAQFVPLGGAPLAGRLAAPAQRTIGGADAPALQQGMASAPIVKDLQLQLNVWRENQWRHQEGRGGWPTTLLPDSGAFDAATTRAVKAFQQSMGLPATGVADAATQNLLKLEASTNYSLFASESNKAQVRRLFADAGADGPRTAALTALLAHGSFTMRLDSGDQGRVIAALAAARGDAALASSLGKLLDDGNFKGLQPEERRALLHHASRHADARTLDRMREKLDGSGDAAAMIGRAQAEWTRDQAGAAPARVLNRNPANLPLPSATGIIPAATWNDPVALVGALTQNARGLDGLNAAMRCGPSNLLAGALLQGPDAAAKFLDKIAADPASRLTPDERSEAKLLAGQVRARNASYEDLSLAQDLVYRAGSRRVSADEWRGEHPGFPGLTGAQATRLAALFAKNLSVTPGELREMSQLVSRSMGRTVTAVIVDEPGLGRGIMLNYAPGSGAGRDGRIDGGLDDGELRTLAAAGATSVAPVAYDRGKPDAVAAVLERLKPGESAVVPLPGSPTGTGADHFISVGVLRDGRPYVYNPSPAPGDATLAVGRAGDPQPQSFVDELAKYSQRANHIAGGAVTALRVTH